MTKLLPIYFGATVGRVCASAFSIELEHVGVHTIKGNWATGYLDWLAESRPSFAVLPRFMAEHDYGSMPFKASLYKAGATNYIVPGRLGIQFDYSMESYGIIWSDLLDAIGRVPATVVICLNMFCQNESEAQVNSANAFRRMVDLRTDIAFDLAAETD